MCKAFILSNPIPATNKSPLISLGKFSRIISSVFETVVIFGGNIEALENIENVRIHSFKCQRAGSKLEKIVSFLKLEILMALSILKYVQRNDQAFFWIADKMLFPFLAAKLKKVTIYYFLMGNVGNEGRKTIFRNISERLILYMAEHADYVCFESHSVISHWKLKPKPERTKIIHLFVESHNELRQTSKENFVGMVCRLVEGKHVLESIEAFSRFLEKNPGWKLQIVGSGKLRDDCERLINRLNLINNVELLGWINHCNLPDITAKWKLLLFPTDAEGLPNGLLETMIQSVPAIASPIGGIVDIIEDGVNGWILSNCSAECIYETMTSALSSPDFLSIAKAAQNTIVQKYTFEASVSNLKEQLQEVTV